jgi:hypothetical protein
MGEDIVGFVVDDPCEFLCCIRLHGERMKFRSGGSISDDVVVRDRS